MFVGFVNRRTLMAQQRPICGQATRRYSTEAYYAQNEIRRTIIGFGQLNALNGDVKSTVVGSLDGVTNTEIRGAWWFC